MRPAFVTLILTLLLAGMSVAQHSPWRELEAGLEMARFDSGLREAREDGDMLVFRIDPEHWQVRALSPGPADDYEGLTTKDWCEGGRPGAGLQRGHVPGRWPDTCGLLQEGRRGHQRRGE